MATNPRSQRRKSKPRSPMRHRVALVFLGLIMGVIFSELALRIIAPLKWHEWALWVPDGHITGRYKPNQEILTATGHIFRVNQHGFRGPDYESLRQHGTLRIAVFGGSAALCYKSAGREKSWPGALEQKLNNQLNIPVEVINLSIAGFTSFTSKINYLCNGRAFEPNVIIFYHTWNDFTRFRSLETTPYRPASVARNRSFVEAVARATQLGRRARIIHFNLTGKKYDVMSAAMEGTGVDLDRPVSPEALNWVRTNFDDVSHWANRDGVLPVLVTQGSLASPENMSDPKIRELHSAIGRGFTLPKAVEAWLEVNKIIEEVAVKNNAIFVDGYSSIPHDTEHIRDNVHLFDKGSEVLASEIARVLLSDDRFLKVVNDVTSERKTGID